MRPRSVLDGRGAHHCLALCLALCALNVYGLGIAVASSPTVTTLTISPDSPVGVGTIVVLKASVTAAGAPVTRGLVSFCNADAPHCEDVAIVGQAQLTATGHATLKLPLGIGGHNVKAVFAGTNHFDRSQSGAEPLTVNGKYSSSLSAGVTTTNGDSFQLTATVTSPGAIAPAGTVSFVDTNHGNAHLGSAPFTASDAALTLVQSFDTGHPSDIMGGFAVADFNGDGILDLVSPGFFLAGIGDGTFAAPKPYVGGDVTLLSGDLNGDGIQDLATGSGTILLGKGDGTFTTKSVLSVGSLQAIADFNGDGIPDLLSVDNANGQSYVKVSLGNGDGTFVLASSTAVPATAATAADLNGDGILDLAVTAIIDGNGTSIVTTLLGHSDGTFTPKSTFGVDTGTFVIASGDFNGDGIADLVTVSDLIAFVPIGGTVTIWLGAGDGSFASLPPYFVPLDSLEVRKGDFNGDGITDLVIARSDSNGDQRSAVVMLLGKGDGTFTTLSVPTTDPQQFAVGDFNGDGITDIATAPGANEPHTLVHLSELVSQASVMSTLSGGDHTIVANYSGDTYRAASSSQPFTVSVPPQAPPKFSPPPGTYAWTQHIALSEVAPDAVIYYTVEDGVGTGVYPGQSRLTYTSRIPVTWESTITAIAVSPTLGTSAPVTGVFVIDRPMTPPTFSLPSGTYPALQTITLSPDPSYCSHATCIVYYTRDGSTPTTSSIKYTGPIKLTKAGTTTIKAIATSHHFTPSRVATETYTIQ